MSDTGIAKPQGHADDRPRLSDETGATVIDRTESTLPARRNAFETQGATARAPIDIDRLYDAESGTSSQIVRALELLREVSNNLSEAQKCDNILEADSFVQRVQLALPKLFTYRSIGDGFGIIINSLCFAFINLRGTPLNFDQRGAVWRVLRELRARPAMSLEQGIQRVEQLEEQGLEVDPPELGDLLDAYEPPEND